MSFGKRIHPNANRTRQVVGQTATPMQTENVVTPDESSGDLIRICGATVALVVGIYCLYTIGMSAGLGFGTRNLPPTKQHFAVIDLCTPDLEATPDMVELSQRHTIRLMGGGKGFKKPEMLHCMMTHSVHRFCTKQNRNAMAQDLIAYFRGAKAASQYLKQYVDRSDITALALNRAHESMKGVSRIQGNRHQKIVSERVVTAMHELIENGYLSESDFGWLYVRKSIKPYLENVSQKQNLCVDSRL